MTSLFGQPIFINDFGMLFAFINNTHFSVLAGRIRPFNTLLGNKRRDKNMTTKERTKEIIDNQPDDATYEEIVRELAFSEMVERGLKDVREGRVISNEEMGKRIRLWQK
ncbi:MAG: hypothetical protein K9K79_01815 [Desulfohalobiaceae bacterium]|nr:hypothetical protein [Desulfohalobiaceae bacterium]